MRLNEMFEEFGPERYPGVIPLGKYLSNDEHEFAPPGDYRDSIELIRAVQELIAAGVGPDIVPADPKQLLATQDWLSNDRGAGALFDEYEDRPVVYEIEKEEIGRAHV